MKKLLCIIFAGVVTFNTAKAQNIAAIRAMAVGGTVTVKGVVTHGNHLGPIRYIQDNSGAIAAYGASLNAVQQGDSVAVEGKLKLFNNLLELDPIYGYTVVTSGKPLPASSTITVAQFNENVEGKLITIMNCKFNASGTFTSSSAANYTVTSGGQTFVIRSTSTDMASKPIPSGTVHITGIASQFCGTPATGCTNGYQLLPRTMADIVAAPAATTTGISEVNMTDVKLYPNPASQEIRFDLDNNAPVTSVMITDVAGKVVHLSTENTNTINISKLNKGLYYIYISSDKDRNYKSKFIVE